MAGGKLTARQKMINLMYLVFIAMMALNIDRQVLRSFDDVDHSLTKSNGASVTNTNIYMENIVKKASEDPTGYAKVKIEAERVNKEANILYDYINGLKKNLDDESGYNEKESNGEPNYAALSNLETVSKLLFINDSKFTDKGNGLIEKINGFNSFLKSTNNTGYIIDINDVKTSDGNRPWLHQKFYGQPMIAAKTVLSELQSRVRNAQGEIIRNMMSSKLLKDLEVNTFVPIVTAPRYVSVGENVQAIVALGAFDNRVQGSANLNVGNFNLLDGKAEFKLNTSSPGKKSISGSVTFKDGAGNPQVAKIAQPIEYEVVAAVQRTQAEAAAAVTADNMNVFYVGLDNPVSAAVVGIEPASLKMSAPGLSYKGNGKGTIKPTSVGKVDVLVTGQSTSGGSFSKSFPFRVKNLPKPEGTVLGKTFLELPSGSLKMQKVSARFVDFEWPLNINVTGFKYKITGRGKQIVSGNSLSSINAKAGQVISIFDIKGTANGVSLKDATTVVIEVKE